MWENIEILNLSQQKLRGNYLVSETNIIPKSFHKICSSNRNEKIFMNKPVYLRLSILELSGTIMYEFWHDYVKQKYGEKAKLCYMDTDIVYIKTDDINRRYSIAEDVETRCDSSNYESDRSLAKGKNKIVIIR